MSFTERLKEAMTEQHITQSELASKIGKGAPSVSQYLSGKSTPRAGVQQLIADTLGCTVEWLNSDGDKEEELTEETVSPYSVSIAEAARRMGKSQQFVRVALQSGVAPFGFAVKNKSTYSYHISRKKFEEYLGT